MTVETTTETTETEATEPVFPVPHTGVGERGTEETAEEPTDEEGKTFDLAYVKKLRKEAATYRERAGKVDELGARLHTALVQASGKLQDATDLAYDPAHLEDPEALTAAIDTLLASKPHLASRRPQGFIPQGATSEAKTGPTLGGLLRGAAG